MESFWREEYLPSLFRDTPVDGSWMREGADEWRVFNLLIGYNSNYYHSTGTADTVGGYGHAGVFLYYIGNVTNENETPEHNNHAYAPAAILGAVSSGIVGIKMLEKLILMGPDVFDFHYIAEGYYGDSQCSLCTYDYSDRLHGEIFWSWLLYAAIDTRNFYVTEWVMNRDTDYDWRDDFWRVLEMWYDQNLEHHSDNRTPKDEYYAFREYANDLANWYKRRN